MRSGTTISRNSPHMIIFAPSVLVITKRQAPPTRRSISHSVNVQARGPRPQRFNSSGLVKQSKTSLRGASKTRVRASSRSLGVVTCNVAVDILLSPFLSFCFQFGGFQFFEKVVQAFKGGFPVLSVIFKPLGSFGQRFGFQAARTPLRLAPV